MFLPFYLLIHLSKKLILCSALPLRIVFPDSVITLQPNRDNIDPDSINPLLPSCRLNFFKCKLLAALMVVIAGKFKFYLEHIGNAERFYYDQIGA